MRPNFLCWLLPHSSPEWDSPAVQKAHKVEIAIPYRSNEGPRVDGAALVHQVLETPKLGGCHDSLIAGLRVRAGAVRDTACRCMKVHRARVAVREQQINAREMAFTDSNVDDGVCPMLSTVAVLQCKSKAVGMTCRAKASCQAQRGIHMFTNILHKPHLQGLGGMMRLRY
jgi:hypothetical protein